MSFSINTNVTSLEAQNYLGTSAAFQGKTINHVTSGLRIVNSGDDAAGLAIANGLRSDQAVLTQGIQNANNGLAALQTIDGGINNISTLLDRASTLAAQSASGTFNGDRNVLNSEFQSVLKEIDRQAQSIGLDTGGAFTKALTVFVGGGQANKGATTVANGSVVIDLSKSAVDGQSLGLNGTQASGATGSDIGNGGGTTVANILSNIANGAGATTSFSFSGAGFSDSGKQTLAVNLAGVTNTDTLVAAINGAIKNATTTSAGASTATPFATAGITAAIHTDASGKQQLTFSSATAAFQVQAGDLVANALLGNFDIKASNSSTGQSLASTVTGGVTSAAATVIAGGVVLRVQGSQLTTPLDIQFPAGQSVALDVAALTTTGTPEATLLAAAGIKASQASPTSPLVFTSATGGSINVSTAGDTNNDLGFGSYINTIAGAGASAFNATSISGAALAAIGGNNGQTLEFSVAGGTAIRISTGAVVAGTAPVVGKAIADALNIAIQKDPTLKAAGLTATADIATGAITFTSGNGTAFRINATTLDGVGGASGTATNLGFGAGTVSGDNAAASATNTLVTNSRVDSAGASSTGVFIFNPTADQTISFSANDASGTTHATSIDLKNQTTAGATLNAQTIDQAIASINKQLQGAGDKTLQQIVAVKDITAGPNGDIEGIKFISSLSTFNVSLGAAGTVAASQGVGSASDQSTVVVSGTGSQADVSTIAGAALAVGTLTNAVSLLGIAQAAVGKGENNLNYAVALATSQNTNAAAAESNIRDANLAKEAANLSKAQILVQAGTAALAQANSAPQAILTLLK